MATKTASSIFRRLGYAAMGLVVCAGLLLTVGNLKVRNGTGTGAYGLSAPKNGNHDLMEADFAQTYEPSDDALTGVRGVSAAPDSARVNVNTASLDELCTLPGIGPAIAQGILEIREQNGPFSYPEDLLIVKRIGEKTLETLRPLICFSE